jgi:hypothetical protein
MIGVYELEVLTFFEKSAVQVMDLRFLLLMLMLLMGLEWSDCGYYCTLTSQYKA